MPQDLSPLWISLKTALLATVITVLLGLISAYWMLHYRGKGKSLIEGVLIAPLVLPPTVVGFLLLLLFGKNGPIGPLLESLDISIVFSWYGATIAAAVVAFPLMYRTALGAFEQVDASLLAVARSLGATEWTIVCRILLPLSVPGILAGTTLAFARALGEFGATLMLAGNIPGETQTIPMAIYFAVEAGAMDEAWFWTIVIMGISLSSLLIVNTWAQRHQQQQGKGSDRGGRRSRLTIAALPSPPSRPSMSATAGLMVDIQKPLFSFPLNLAFHTTGSTLGILGGSGAGKSMLLRCIAGIATPTSGRIELNGRVLFDSKRGINVPSRDRRIGLVVQNYALFPHMTVAQNIAFGLPRSLSSRAKQQQIAAQLEMIQLTGLGDRYPHQLSGGQQQRVALARALANQPEALLLDEPFSALDTYLRSQMEQETIARLREYPGVSLLVTHNLEEAYRVCPTLLVLHQGQAIAHGPKQAIFEHPTTPTVAQLTGCKNVSRATALSSDRIRAIDWGIELQIVEPIPNQLTSVGIRAHQLTFTDDPQAVNTVPCWLAMTSETPHRMTLFLKLNGTPEHPQDAHLQVEVFKEKWATLKDRPFPWYVRLDPLRLMLLSPQASGSAIGPVAKLNNSPENNGIH